MMRALYTAATGMKVQQKSVDVISNNLANVNTSGFKKSQPHFEDLIYVTETRPGFSATGIGSSTGVQIGSGARLVATAKMFTQGVLNQTGGRYDIAIQGAGFLEVSLPDGSFAYTRAGNLGLDANQQLVNSDGYKLEPAISLSGGPYESITISKDGEIFGYDGVTESSLGNITLCTFLNDAGLESVGSNLFRETVSSGPVTKGLTPGENGIGKLEQGYLEKSNVEVVNELVGLIIAQRAYEVNSKAIKTSDDMLSLANSIAS